MQPLVAVSLTGMRFSRLDTHPEEKKTAQEFTPTQGLCLIKNTFISLDSLELKDLLQFKDSPFSMMATSLTSEHSKQGMFSFKTQIELDAMSWESHQMVVASDWGFKMSPSTKKRNYAIDQLTAPSSYFDKSLGHQHFVAFRSVVHENGLHCIDVDVQHLIAQWNPSTIIALQRFIGRLKKAALTILKTPTAKTVLSPSDTLVEDMPPKEPPKTPEPQTLAHNVIFSVNANIESICICLSEC